MLKLRTLGIVSLAWGSSNQGCFPFTQDRGHVTCFPDLEIILSNPVMGSSDFVLGWAKPGFRFLNSFLSCSVSVSYHSLTLLRLSLLLLLTAILVVWWRWRWRRNESDGRELWWQRLGETGNPSTTACSTDCLRFVSQSCSQGKRNQKPREPETESDMSRLANEDDGDGEMMLIMSGNMTYDTFWMTHAYK